MTEYPTDWIPDLLVFLWRKLEKRVHEVEHVGVPREAERLELMLSASGEGAVPESVTTYLRGMPGLGFATDIGINARMERQWVVARCIDRVLQGAHPRRWAVAAAGNSTPRPLRRRTFTPSPCEGVVWSHYNSQGNGRYNRAQPGLLLPKAPLGHFFPDLEEPPPSELGHHIKTFAYIDPSAGKGAWEVRHERLAWRHDVTPPDSLGDIRVATVPWAEDADSLKPSTRYDAAGRTALISFQRESNDGASRARARALVDELVRERVTIAVLPEFALSRADLIALKDALQAASNGPAIVVAGTCLSDDLGPSGVPYNESLVFDQAGQLLWTQRKRYRAAMSPNRLRDYGLLEDMAAEESHTEDFARDNKLVVADGALGRMVVLICEDLQQTDSEELGRLRPDWVFCPVLDGDLEVGRWSHQRAFERTSVQRPRVVISNSLFLSLRLREVITKAGDRGPDAWQPPVLPIVGMLCDPGGWADAGETASPQEPQVLDGHRFCTLTVDHNARRSTPLFACSAWSPRGWQKITLTGRPGPPEATPATGAPPQTADIVI